MKIPIKFKLFEREGGMKPITAILLGAGESKRMGQNKLLLPWGKRTILERSLQTLLNSRVKEVILVVNDQTQEKARQWEDQRVKVVFNPEYRKGMSRSIHQGIRTSDPISEGFLIALGDQPTLKSRTINLLIEAFQKAEGKIIAPSFQGRRGHPVIFPRKYREELLKLRGDEGGKSILNRHSKEVLVVPVRSKEVIRDIDTPGDYKEGLKGPGKRLRMEHTS